MGLPGEEQLRRISNSDGANPATSVTYGASWATLGADMDLRGAAYGGSVSTGADGTQFESCLPWEPIAPSPGGSGSANPYTGTFDGAGHKVTNMYVTGRERLGFFAGLGNSGVIQNLGIESGKVNDTGSMAAGVLADITGSNARVSNCYNKAYVTGQHNSGGIVGRTNQSNAPNATIENCYNAGNVTQTSGDSTGGIIGKIHSGNITISNCYNTGTITGPRADLTGGIMGNKGSYVAVFQNCYNAGPLSSASSAQIYGGGGTATVTNCYYDDANVGNANGAKSLTTDVLKSWSAAYALNGGFTGGSDGSGKITSMTTWRMAQNARENAGMPVLVSINGINYEDQPCMDAAGSWEDIGQYMDVFNPSTIPTYDAARGGWQVTTPEEFAYVAYTVNTKNADNNEPAALAGETVTYGNSSIALRAPGRLLDMKGTKYVNGEIYTKSRLEWMPIGKTSVTTAGAQEGYRFGGSLAGDPDGTGTPTTLCDLDAYDKTSGAYASGLIGWAAVDGQDMTISDIAIGGESS
ncbi:MAG: hypothetical protein ACLSVD_14085, partial [Eggerthellaceae bacterium]